MWVGKGTFPYFLHAFYMILCISGGKVLRCTNALLEIQVTEQVAFELAVHVLVRGDWDM